MKYHVYISCNKVSMDGPSLVQWKGVSSANSQDTGLICGAGGFRMLRSN